MHFWRNILKVACRVQIWKKTFFKAVKSIYMYLPFIYKAPFILRRGSHRRCSVRKGVLRNFENFTGKHLCQSPFFNKVAGLRTATLLKKRLWHRCFPVNIAKFLRTPFLQNISGQLLVFTSI